MESLQLFLHWRLYRACEIILDFNYKKTEGTPFLRPSRIFLLPQSIRKRNAQTSRDIVHRQGDIKTGKVKGCIDTIGLICPGTASLPSTKNFYQVHASIDERILPKAGMTAIPVQLPSSVNSFCARRNDLDDQTRRKDGILLSTMIIFITGGIPPNWQQFDLIALLKDVASLLQTPSVRIEVHAPPQLPIDADADRLRQALENVLANALQHSPKGTTISVTLRCRQKTTMCCLRSAIKDLASPPNSSRRSLRHFAPEPRPRD